MLSYILASLAAFLLYASPASGQAAGTASLLDQPDYKTGRPCMRDCLYYLNGNIGCQNVDSCVCRADLAPPITRYLSTCIMSACSFTIDVNSGISIYQAYCSGKIATQDPVVTAVATQEIVETTVIDRQIVEITATETSTAFETVVVSAVQTLTSFSTLYTTETVEDVSTFTSITGTETTKVPTSVTQVVYSTFATVITDSSSLQSTLDWLGGGGKELSMDAKIAIGFGVATGVAVVAFLVALCCCLARRTELKRWKDRGVPGVGGNEGWRIHDARDRADLKSI
ncbi:hypothetical protein TWF696_006648 [Orbilia brochopaga]|uniref:Extracellular membrane protein CFEM domain-containing protein n=1 Tax=Orbilia brochopaga TaxID=3140254 RepID=A0AAV9UPH1_9PEZI